jgi:hypothetical protein
VYTLALANTIPTVAFSNQSARSPRCRFAKRTGAVGTIDMTIPP